MRGKGFVAELKVALIVRRERDRGGTEEPLLISQHDLIEHVVKFERNLDLLDPARAIVLHGAEDEGHFLVQEVGRARTLGSRN